MSRVCRRSARRQTPGGRRSCLIFSPTRPPRKDRHDRHRDSSYYVRSKSADRSSGSATDLHRLSVFEPKIFAELKNAQAIALAYDGLNPLPPSYCYLKPYYLDPNRSYFEQLARGEI